MFRAIINNEDIQESSIIQLLRCVNEEPCCFITAYRGESNYDENAKRNQELESEIRYSGLSFIKIKGSYPETQDDISDNQESDYSYCVIDNKYGFKQFKLLCTEWGNKYDQDSILITTPVVDKVENGRKLFVGVGQLYDKSGNALGEKLTDITFHDIEDYFSKIGESPFAFIEVSDSVETEGWSMRSYQGHVRGDQEFRKKYPHLI